MLTGISRPRRMVVNGDWFQETIKGTVVWCKLYTLCVSLEDVRSLY